MSSSINYPTYIRPKSTDEFKLKFLLTWTELQSFTEDFFQISYIVWSVLYCLAVWQTVKFLADGLEFLGMFNKGNKAKTYVYLNFLGDHYKN